MASLGAGLVNVDDQDGGVLLVCQHRVLELTQLLGVRAPHQRHRGVILGAPVGLREVTVTADMQHIAAQVGDQRVAVGHPCRGVIEATELVAGKRRDINRGGGGLRPRRTGVAMTSASRPSELPPSAWCANSWACRSTRTKPGATSLLTRTTLPLPTRGPIWLPIR